MIQLHETDTTNGVCGQLTVGGLGPLLVQPLPDWTPICAISAQCYPIANGIGVEIFMLVCKTEKKLLSKISSI